MRWASNREVFTMMNNRGMGMPTNPEAGPGDTVPAMLTPGEAVIPAPAAQNPMNKPMIQSMINEGRIKNDMQEVPTYEKPPAPSLSIDIIGGMDSKHIFEVYMEKMKQERNQEALNKTMGVPLLMANGGMVPGYENGISEAGAMDYLKDALMAPKRIKDSLFGDTPSLLEQSRIDRGIPPVDIQAEVGLYTQTQEQEMLAKEAEREIKNLQALEQANLANQAKAAELNLIANDPMADPSARRVAAARANQIAGTNITPVPRTSPPAVIIPENAQKTPSGSNNVIIEETGDKGNNNVSKFLSGLGKKFGNGFKNTAKRVFDEEALAQGAIYYGVNRLLGYNNDTAAQQAMLGYTAAQERIAKDLEYRRELGLENLEVQKKRDDAANKNRGQLRSYAENTLGDIFTVQGTEEEDLRNTKSFLVQEGLSRIDNLGLDLSTEGGLESAKDVFISMANNYNTQLRSGFESPNMQRAFDEVMLSKKEIPEAFTIPGDTPRPVSNKAIQGSFERIRRSINADPAIANNVKQAEFENRIAQLYRLYKSDPNQVAALGLRAPSAGENEFTVFLEHVINQK